MAAEYEVFISHKTEDLQIAQALRQALQRLSNGKLQVNVCEQMQGGTEWRQWIEERIRESKLLVFLYTGEDADWRWCLYELGLFRGGRIAEGAALVCIKEPDIEKPPSPIEHLQSYDRDEDDIARFFTDLLHKGLFTDKKPLNPDLFTDSETKKDFDRWVRKVATIHSEGEELFRDRVLITVSETDEEGEGIHPLADPTVSGTPSAMRLLGLTARGASLSRLEETYRLKGDDDWLRQLRESIAGIREGNPPHYVMRPFKSPDDGRHRIPVLARFETIRLRAKDPQREPKSLNVIFVSRPASERWPLPEIFGHWSTGNLPSSVVRVKYKKRSGAVQYEEGDLDGAPVVAAANSAFGNLFNFDHKALPPPDSARPLTAGRLFDFVKGCVDPAHLQSLKDDQGDVSTRVLLLQQHAAAKVPLQLNDKHRSREYANHAYLPCVVCKDTVGDKSGPHVAYLLVTYVRHFQELSEAPA